MTVIAFCARRATSLLATGLAACFLLVAAAGPASAVRPDEVLKDPALEERARDLSAQLRCLVCQNQSIDESDAPLARDLRFIVRERLTAGDTDRAVLDYLVDRYGEYVLLTPRFGMHTLVLWGITPLLLICGLIGVVFFLRGRQARPAGPTALTPEEEARVEALLRDGK
ncbi:MAG: cytochrome c-type biogenesis protein [Pseudomonadota bacterium]